jgi:hypothetical protein
MMTPNIGARSSVCSPTPGSALCEAFWRALGSPFGFEHANGSFESDCAGVAAIWLYSKVDCGQR